MPRMGGPHLVGHARDFKLEGRPGWAPSGPGPAMGLAPSPRMEVPAAAQTDALQAAPGAPGPCPPPAAAARPRTRTHSRRARARTAIPSAISCCGWLSLPAASSSFRPHTSEGLAGPPIMSVCIRASAYATTARSRSLPPESVFFMSPLIDICALDGYHREQASRRVPTNSRSRCCHQLQGGILRHRGSLRRRRAGGRRATTRKLQHRISVSGSRFDLRTRKAPEPACVRARRHLPGDRRGRRDSSGGRLT